MSAAGFAVAVSNPARMTERWVREALERKRDGHELPGELWQALIAAYVRGALGDDVKAALLMAATIRGLTVAETFAVTVAMIDSGERVSLPQFTLDKHSTGGVGDDVTLAVVPLVAACGARVAKLSGRALGHTGGTLDKLEAIPGVRTELSPEAFAAQIDRIGCAIAAQSDRLAPADKRLYALRDRTATVASPGLIAASVVSKKIAGGAAAIVYDVKTGAGAFMRRTAEAVQLAELLVELSARFDRRAVALVTDMDQPLGCAIGPVLEAVEVRDYLAGVRRDPRFHALVTAVGGEMLQLAGIPPERLDEALTSGAGYERFVALVEAQGGTRGALTSLRPSSDVHEVTADRDGVIAAIDPVALGVAARELAATTGPGAGIVIERRVGERVSAGERVALVYGASVRTHVASAFTLAVEAPPLRPLIASVTRDAAVAPAAKRSRE